MALSAENFDL
jgi:hypothetical protein